MHKLLVIARTYFLESARRQSFLFVNLATLLLVLPQSAGLYRVSVNGDRLSNTPSWAALSATAIWLPYVTFVGFFFGKGSLRSQRNGDHEELFSTTSLSYSTHLASLFLARLVILLIPSAIAFGVCAAGQAVDNETSGFSPLPFIQVFTFLVVPTLITIASLTVIADTLKPISQAVINVLYLAVWIGGLSAMFSQMPTYLDWTGFGFVYRRFASLSNGHSVFVSLFTASSKLRGDETWTSLQFETSTLKLRIAQVTFSVAAIALAGKLTMPLRSAFRSFSKPEFMSDSTRRCLPSRSFRVQEFFEGSQAMTLLFAEWSMIARGQSIIWWASLGVFICFELLTKSLLASTHAVIVAWLLVAPVLAQLVVKHKKYRTEDVLNASSSKGFLRLSTAWLAGCSMLLIAASGTLIRLIVSGHVFWDIDLVVGSCLLTSLGLTLGLVSQGARLAEAVYILLWYLGPLRQDVNFDFTFSSKATNGTAIAFGVTSAALCAISLALQRSRQK